MKLQYIVVEIVSLLLLALTVKLCHGEQEEIAFSPATTKFLQQILFLPFLPRKGLKHIGYDLEQEWEREELQGKKERSYVYNPGN